MITRYCDKCGEVIRGHWFEFVLDERSSENSISDALSAGFYRERSDLCRDCAEKIATRPFLEAK